MSSQKRVPTLTKDGSSTLFIPDWNEHYHSSHGAIQEAQHVFIKNGLQQLSKENITIIEYGFGTGLNTFITALESEKRSGKIHYIGLEKYPVNFDEIKTLNYTENLNDPEDYFGKIHRIPWEKYVHITTDFQLQKKQIDFREYTYTEKVDLVYFDAFGFRVQPHLWESSLFQNIYDNLNNGGLLTTYSSKGVVRRSLEDIGFEVEKIPGPAGKREMINAWKR